MSWRFAMNQITTPALSAGAAIDCYAKNGVEGIAYWVDPVRETGLAATAKRAREAGIFAASLCTSAWMTADPEKAAKDENLRRLEMAAELGAPVLVMVLGGVNPSIGTLADNHSFLRDGLLALTDAARDLGVSIGVEPLHPMYASSRSCINSYAQALSLAQELGSAGAVVPDVYHCWWDPEFLNGLRCTDPDMIPTFHLCDWKAETESFRDRGMVGDGIADLDSMLATLRDIAFSGDFELELFSDQDWWTRDPDEVVQIAKERCLPLIAKYRP